MGRVWLLLLLCVLLVRADVASQRQSLLAYHFPTLGLMLGEPQLIPLATESSALECAALAALKQLDEQRVVVDCGGDAVLVEWQLPLCANHETGVERRIA